MAGSDPIASCSNAPSFDLWQPAESTDSDYGNSPDTSTYGSTTDPSRQPGLTDYLLSGAPALKLLEEAPAKAAGPTLRLVGSLGSEAATEATATVAGNLAREATKQAAGQGLRVVSQGAATPLAEAAAGGAGKLLSGAGALGLVALGVGALAAYLWLGDEDEKPAQQPQVGDPNAPAGGDKPAPGFVPAPATPKTPGPDDADITDAYRPLYQTPLHQPETTKVAEPLLDPRHNSSTPRNPFLQEFGEPDRSFITAPAHTDSDRAVASGKSDDKGDGTTAADGDSSEKADEGSDEFNLADHGEYEYEERVVSLGVKVQLFDRTAAQRLDELAELRAAMSTKVGGPGVEGDFPSALPASAAERKAVLEQYLATWRTERAALEAANPTPTTRLGLDWLNKCIRQATPLLDALEGTVAARPASGDAIREFTPEVVEDSDVLLMTWRDRGPVVQKIDDELARLSETLTAKLAKANETRQLVLTTLIDITNKVLNWPSASAASPSQGGAASLESVMKEHGINNFPALEELLAWPLDDRGRVKPEIEVDETADLLRKAVEKVPAEDQPRVDELIGILEDLQARRAEERIRADGFSHEPKYSFPPDATTEDMMRISGLSRSELEALIMYQPQNFVGTRYEDLAETHPALVKVFENLLEDLSYIMQAEDSTSLADQPSMTPEAQARQIAMLRIQVAEVREALPTLEAYRDRLEADGFTRAAHAAGIRVDDVLDFLEQAQAELDKHGASSFN